MNISIIRTFVTIRNYLIQQSTASHEIEKLWNHVKSLEEQTEENLKTVNDLSDDTQNTFDEIYIALSEMAQKQKKSMISLERELDMYKIMRSSDAPYLITFSIFLVKK